MIKWDLSELFSNVNDSKIEQIINESKALANKFEKTFKGKIVDLTPNELLLCIRTLENLEAKFSDISLYSSLSFAANMTLSQTQSLYDKLKKLKALIGKQLTFFELELGELLKNNNQLLSDPILDNYSHMLERILRDVKHQLSEIEEQLIIEKDQFGIYGWKELQSKWLNTKKFEVTVLGEKKLLSYGKANGLLTHSDRNTRKSANKSIYGSLGKDGEIFSSALRNICNDWINNCKRRKYSSPIESSLISNDTNQEIINNLINTIDANSKIYRRYLKLKAKLMELPKLGNFDIVAPLPDLPELKYSYKQAQDLIIKACNRFDSEYANSVKEMFSKKHIDAEPRYGKRNGAFCASYYNGQSAYILTSFNETLSDVFTLAHELGHATHDWYASRNQTYLNMDIPSVTAEIASIFGELLLTDLLLEEAQTDTEKKAILCMVLDEAGMTTFQVTARVWFEQALYTSIQKDEFLDFKTICNHWTTARDRIYKEAVDWLPEMEAEWTMKPHYYMPNYRFYNYPYVYAQMFVYSLYEKYKEEGKTFCPKLKKALSAGGSISPLEIGKIFDFNITEPEFWNKGMRVFEYFTNNLLKII